MRLSVGLLPHVRIEMGLRVGGPPGGGKGGGGGSVQGGSGFLFSRREESVLERAFGFAFEGAFRPLLLFSLSRGFASYAFGGVGGWSRVDRGGERSG